MCDGDTPGRSPTVWPRSRFRLYGLPMAATAGILLTGGRSRRLGIDKATLVARRRDPRGCVPARRLARGVRPRGRGRRRRERAPGRPRERRRGPARSPPSPPPATGCASAGTHGAALLLAVDLPARRRAASSRWLRDRPGEPTAVLRVDGRLQPVCARYGADALLAAESLVVGGVRALHELLDVVDHDVVEEAEWAAVASARRVPRRRHAGRRRAARDRPPGVSVKR